MTHARPRCAAPRPAWRAPSPIRALFIAGGDSPFVRTTHYPAVRQYFPHARVETLPGVGARAAARARCRGRPARAHAGAAGCAQATGCTLRRRRSSSAWWRSSCMRAPMRTCRWTRGDRCRCGPQYQIGIGGSIGAARDAWRRMRWDLPPASRKCAHWALRAAQSRITRWRVVAAACCWRPI